MFATNLPNDWVNTCLNEVGSVITGKTPSKKNPDFFNGDIPFIKPSDIYDQGVIVDTEESITELGAETVPTLPPASIVVTCIGNLGRVAITSKLSATNQQINAVIPSEQLHNQYIYYQVRTLKSWMLSESSATTVTIINKSKFSKAPIRLPPLAEQKVIADKLDTLLAQVETIKTRLERIPTLLKTFRQSVLAAAVSGRLTEGWRKTNEYSLSFNRYLESLGEFKVKAKGLNSAEESDKWLSCQVGHVISVSSGDGLTAKAMNSDGGIPVYGGNGVTGFHDQSNTAESCVVIGRVGFYCGSVHLTEERAWITDNALVVNFPPKLMTKHFVYWMLRGTNLRVDSASSAQPVISGAKIYSLEISVPPPEEQTEIVHQVEKLFAHADKIEQQANAALARVNNLTQSILAKAFRGELTADWRAANPDLISGENSAEALLARIKAEREALKPKKKTRAKKAKV